MKLFRLPLIWLLLYPVACMPLAGLAGDADAAYTRVIAQRADRILAPMNLTDPARRDRVQAVIMRFYRELSELHDARDGAIAAVRGQPNLPAPAADAGARAIREAVEREQLALGHAFTGWLAAELTPDQVVAVKDGITNGVVAVTWNAYMRMLPDLADEHRRFIMAQLAQAREHAVTAGSSEGRHRVFGRAKGRINNRLSAAGIDRKQAEADLRARGG
jgi:AcrR family transcriptional regulator